MPYREYSYLRPDPTSDLVMTLKMRLLDLEDQVRRMRKKIEEITGEPWSE